MARWYLAFAIAFAALLVVSIGFSLPTITLARLIAVAAVLGVLPGIFAVIRRRDGASIAGLLVGALVPPAIAVVVHYLTHPVLHVDNATGGALQIWVDGEPVLVTEPTPPEGEPPRVRVPYGHRRLGWSALGATMPDREIEADLALRGEHLYNPRSLACYWLEATAYGDASTHELPHGPQPIDQLYHFERIDVWFGENPKHVRTSSLSRGAFSIALQRYRFCMELAHDGCSPDARDDFVTCLRTLHAASDHVDCYAEARKRCPSKGKAEDPGE